MLVLNKTHIVWVEPEDETPIQSAWRCPGYNFVHSKNTFIQPALCRIQQISPSMIDTGDPPVRLEACNHGNGRPLTKKSLTRWVFRKSDCYHRTSTRLLTRSRDSRAMAWLGSVSKISSSPFLAFSKSPWSAYSQLRLSPQAPDAPDRFQEL